MTFFYVLDAITLGPRPATLVEWTQWKNDHSQLRRVGYSALPHAVVETVFEGLATVETDGVAMWVTTIKSERAAMRVVYSKTLPQAKLAHRDAVAEAHQQQPPAAASTEDTPSETDS
jgi:hypothetical protein